MRCSEEQALARASGSRKPAGVWMVLCAVVGAMAFIPMCSMSAQSSEEGSFRSLLERGFALHQRADYVDALTVLRQAWKLEPHDYFANLLIGIDLLRTNRPNDAIGYLEEAARQRPKEDFPYEYLGEALARLRRYADAVAAYEHAVSVAPASPQAIEGAAGYSVERFRELAAQLRATNAGLAAEQRLQARAHSANDPLRREFLRRSAELDPNAPGIWGELALADARAGDEEDARAHLSNALARDAADQSALEAEARLAAASGDWKKALHALERIGDASPRRLMRVAGDWSGNLQPPAEESDRRLAGFFRCAGSVDRSCTTDAIAGRAESAKAVPATALFQEHKWERLLASTAPSPQAAESWYRRGVAFAETGQCAAALPALERAVAGDLKEKIHGEFLLSWCYAQEAGRITSNLPETREDAALIHMVHGDVLLRMQANSKGAIQEYEAARDAHPNDPEILERLAEAQYEEGTFADATETARSALSIDPNRFSAMQTLAHIAIDQRNYRDAIPYLEQILAHEPANTGAQVDLGNALAATGKPAEAVQRLKPLLDAGYPDEKGNLHATLGAALRKLNRTTEAAQAFAQSRALSQSYQSSAHRGVDEPK